MLHSYDNTNIQYYIDSYSDMITRIACTNLTNLSDVQDVLQDVFIKLLKYGKPFADRNHEKAWIIRVTVNTCRDYNKSFWRTNVDLVQEQIIHVRDRVEKNELIATVRSIPHKYANVIYLHYYEGYSVAEISELLGKKKNTVLSHLRRGRILLKSVLEGED